MAAIPIQNIAFSNTAVTPSFAQAAAEDTIAVAGEDRVFLAVRNGGESFITVTIAPAVTPVSVPGIGSLTVPSVVVTVPADGERWVGPIPGGYVASGVAGVAYSDVTDVTRAAFRVGPPV